MISKVHVKLCPKCKVENVGLMRTFDKMVLVGGLVVSVLAFYCNDLRSNPFKVLQQLLEKEQNKRKRDRELKTQLTGKINRSFR